MHYTDNITGRTRLPDDTEIKLQSQYKPIYSEPILSVRPGIVTDLFGKILVWYLPSILHPDRQVCAIIRNTHIKHTIDDFLEKALRRSLEALQCIEDSEIIDKLEGIARALSPAGRGTWAFGEHERCASVV